MELREVASSCLIFILVCCLSTVETLKCKCTQSSWKTACEKGICEVPDGNGGKYPLSIINKATYLFSACLMLDHPISGKHYACSQSPARQPDCIEKTTKSGAKVKVCSCDSDDFCNFQMWPSETPEAPLTSSIKDGRKELQTANNSPATRWSYFLLLTPLILLKIIRL